MESPEYALDGTRMVILHKMVGDAQFDELVLVIALQEETSRVLKNSGPDDSHSCQAGLHHRKCASAPQDASSRHLIAAATNDQQGPCAAGHHELMSNEGRARR